MPQFRNRLEDRRSKDDKMPRRMWKAVKASAGKVRMGKTEGGGNKGRSRKEMRGKTKTKETKKGKSSRGEKSGRGMGNLEQRREGGEVRSRGEKAGPRKIPQVDQGLWQKNSWRGCSQGKSGIILLI